MAQSNATAQIVPNLPRRKPNSTAEIEIESRQKDGDRLPERIGTSSAGAPRPGGCRWPGRRRGPTCREGGWSEHRWRWRRRCCWGRRGGSTASSTSSPGRWRPSPARTGSTSGPGDLPPPPFLYFTRYILLRMKRGGDDAFAFFTGLCFDAVVGGGVRD